MLSARSQGTCTAVFNYTAGTNGTIFFTSNSVPQSSPATTITWTLAGASPSFTTGFNISATYSVNGIYTVYISNSTPTVGCFTTQAYTINITNVLCLVSSDFTVSSQGPNGQVNFSNLSSGATSFTWNFGDGNSSNTISPTNTYSANGIYTVSLIASNGVCDSSYSSIIQVNSYTCSADFVYTVSPSGIAGFSAVSIPLHASNLYQWDFGNAATYTAVGIQTAQVSYSVAGTYNVLHELRTPNNCVDTVLKFVTPCFLNASFVYAQGSSGVATFSNTTLSSPGAVSYTWSFGDGNFSTAASPVHKFPANANYTVTLYAQHGLCQSDTTVVININSYVPCVIKASFTHTVGESGWVDFRNTTAHNSTPDIEWDFGDGYKGKGQTESHQYQNGGTHYVLMVASDTANPGCVDSVRQAVNITGITCNAIAHFSIIAGSAPGTWLIVPSYPWNISNATWTWGDGATSNSMLSFHSYSVTGTFSVCLTVTASCGQTGKFCAPVTFTGTQNNVYVSKPTVSGLHEPGITERNLLVYPNPADDQLNLQIALTGKTMLSVFDAKGQLVINRGPLVITGEYQLDVTGLPAGIYLLRCTNSTVTAQRRFVVAR